MKKQNWNLGLVISLGISLITISTRVIRTEAPSIHFIVSGILYNLLFCFSLWVIYSWLFNRPQIQANKKNILFVSTLSIICTSLLSFPFDYLFSKISNNVLQLTEVHPNKRAYILFLRGLLVSGLFYFINYYLYVLAEKQRNKIEIEQLKQAQLAAKLSSLKEQLSPHFLFNTLNTLSSLTKEKAAKDYVAELANVYRYVLQYKEQDTATLQQELLFIESYLYILKTRMENAIDLSISVGNSVMPAKIPPLTLQLLIENAIKHNIASVSRQLKIEIKNSKDNYLVVMNNLQPKMTLRASTGTGLSNILQRYRLLFSKEIIIEKNDAFFIVKLPLIC